MKVSSLAQDPARLRQSCWQAGLTPLLMAGISSLPTISARWRSLSLAIGWFCDRNLNWKEPTREAWSKKSSKKFMCRDDGATNTIDTLRTVPDRSAGHAGRNPTELAPHQPYCSLFPFHSAIGRSRDWIRASPEFGHCSSLSY